MFKRIPFIIKILVVAFLINLVVSGLVFGVAPKENKGEKIFQANCSGCHLNGQNLVKPEKPIIGSLKLKSKQAFIAHLQNPPPPMPNFKNIVEKQGQLDSLYGYVLTLMSK